MNGCSIPACQKLHYGLGFCAMHYARNRRYGSPHRVLKPANGTTGNWLKTVAMHWDSDVCLVYPYGTGSHGYGVTTIDGERYCAHVFICEMKHGAKPTPEHEVAHSCRTKLCVNWRHVRWDTREGNMHDKIAHGTVSRGEKHGGSVLTEDDVFLIRGAAGNQTDIANQFGVSQQTVSDIKRGRKWAWL